MATPQILVVEDEGIVAEEIRGRLQDLGYTVPAVAHSGEKAIEKAEEIRPDLVLMDIKLKGKMDGVEAAEKIHACFDIPVVYLTSHADRDTLKRVKITKPFGFITKPFEERELHAALEIALYKHRAEQERKQLIAELKESLEKVKTLSGILSICASCKKIRDDRGYWNQIESYIRDRSEAEFSHGICPECCKKLYPEFYDKEKTKEAKAV